MKQRLVGALVLLSGGIVLWSVLFTGPAAYRVDRTTQIPPPPEFAMPEPAKPVRPVNIPEVEEPTPLPPPDVVSDSNPVATEAKPVKARTNHVVDISSAQPESAAPVSEKDTTSQSSTKKSSEPEPTLSPETGVPNAWVIQVAAFGSPDNADKLAAKLNNKGYKAYVQKRKTSAGKWLYRVFVGPELEEARALAKKSEIESSFHLKTMLTKYEP